MAKKEKSSLIPKNKKQGLIINFIACIALVVIMGLFTNKENAQVIWICSVFVILATSLNIVLGFLGQLALGHCGFMAIGAYSGALIALAFERKGEALAAAGQINNIFSQLSDTSNPKFYLTLILCIIVGGILAAVVGLIVGIPALRLRGDYLAIITLGFGLIICNIINNLPFAGAEGLDKGSASPILYNNGLYIGTGKKLDYTWFIILITIVCVALMFTFIRSKFGRAIKAIRDDDIASSASGLNTSFYKVLGFSISAFFAGVAGVLYSATFNSITTASFSFTSNSIYNSIFIVVMVVLGGMGSLTGSIISAIVMILLNNLILSIPSDWFIIGAIAKYPMLLYAVILIIVIMFRPKGLLGTREFSLRGAIFEWPKKLKNKKTAKAEEGGNNNG